MQLHWLALNVNNVIIKPIKTKEMTRIDWNSTNTASFVKNTLYTKKRNNIDSVLCSA
jgi:hypothetical protein